jgi:hypothetical protein
LNPQNARAPPMGSMFAQSTHGVLTVSNGPRCPSGARAGVDGFDLPSAGRGAPFPHLRRDWAHPTSAPGLGSPLLTSAPGLGSPPRHLLFLAHPCHILRRDSRQVCDLRRFLDSCADLPARPSAFAPVRQRFRAAAPAGGPCHVSPRPSRVGPRRGHLCAGTLLAGPRLPTGLGV